MRPVIAPVHLPVEEWTARTAAHEARMDRWIAPHRERRRRGEKHPVLDFLFTYYSQTPGRLRRWHPGPGAVLDGPAPHARWRWYRADADGVRLDVAAYVADRGDTLRFIRHLLAATASRPASTGCFGLHEWAMVYRDRQTRHAVPLRLGPAGTDAVVEAHTIRCTHYDAFRFFTPEAVGRNRLQPTRESQSDLEQPGCLHAGMDLYKWAGKLGPATPGELLTDCFELAIEIRELDMRASPYDLRDHGYEPVAVETPEGKAEYAAAQRAFAERGAVLRQRLVDVCDDIVALPDDTPARCRPGSGAAPPSLLGEPPAPVRRDRAEYLAKYLLSGDFDADRPLGAARRHHEHPRPRRTAHDRRRADGVRSHPAQRQPADPERGRRPAAGRRARRARGDRPAHDRRDPAGGPRSAARGRRGHAPALHPAARAGPAHRRLRRRGGRVPARPARGLGGDPAPAPGGRARPGRAPAVRSYLGYLGQRAVNVVAALRALTETPEGASVVHCAAGKDRTGVVCAFALAVAGVGHEEIVADYAMTADVIEALVAKLAASPTYAEDMVTRDVASHTPRAATMDRVLTLLDERYGGPTGWLTAHGFGADEQAALRSRLRD
ncbi:tyrosine-protein phosphatase [Blastococcus sp. PRF04-17]|nr:tyrosine-protein phosphatase [Blastococcus sp. PRF04-17]